MKIESSRLVNGCCYGLPSPSNSLAVHSSRASTTPPLFLTNEGEPINPDSLTEYVRRYVDDNGIGKRGSCHLFCHTMATRMLEHGADIRHIEAMLGHAKLTTTEIDTQVRIRKLHQIYGADSEPGT